MQKENIYLNQNQTIQYKEVNRVLYQRKYNHVVGGHGRWSKVGLIGEATGPKDSHLLTALFQVEDNIGELIPLHS